MCGIAGLFDIKGSRAYPRELIGRMTDSLVHRGPDGSGLHLEAGLALGHRRLAIIDLAGGAQPMQTQDGALTVVFNGEIYNFQSLRAELEARGACFLTRSDTEVLLHGWRAWGLGLLPRLNGMFAFALYDATDATLVLARDRFGKKPLHYTISADGTLAFGSEIKALLQAPDAPRAFNPQAVADFFAYGYVPDPKTIYRGIEKLPPAHALVVRRGGAPLLRRYWSILETLGAPNPADADALTERLAEAVRVRLVSDVPLGAMLSGGVDSSAVVALMSEAGCAQPRTFSITFGDRDYDESGYARMVAEQYRCAHDERRLDPDDFSLIPRLPEIYDEPFGDVSAIPTFAVCAQARRSVTVALSGDGGDEALAGYRRYKFHALEERIRRATPAPLRRPLLAGLAAHYPRHDWIPRPLRAATTLRELSLDAAGAYVCMVSALDEATRRSLFTEDFRRELHGYDPGEVVRAAYQVDAPLDPLQRAQYADLATYLPGDILTKVDRASMANSLELRSPLLDPEFFAWSFNLPPGAKLSRTRGGKALLKRALETRLPRDLLYRPKRGFTVPLARWLRGPLRDQIRALGHSARLDQHGAIDLSTVRRLVDAHLSGAADNSKALWLVWTFDAFLAHADCAGLRGAAAQATRRPTPALP